MSRKLLVINSVAGIKSTGRIVTDIIEQYEGEGYECKVAYGRWDIPEKYKGNSYKIGNRLDLLCHVAQTRLFDRHGLGSYWATKRFIQWASMFNPDILWLHNIHGYYINYPVLFKWIKTRPGMEVKWTLHDCWSFTGHCAHFEEVSCYKWENGCSKCPQKTQYPQSKIFDNSKYNYKAKKEAFLGVADLTIYTPSKWLANLVGRSFLSEYKAEVQYNKIDLTDFKPMPSDFRIKNGLNDKIIVLGAASSWGASKGLYDFFQLRKKLNDKYAIVMVGLSNKQLRTVPPGIIGKGLTHSKKELAEIYSAADVFLNPTYSDTYPTVNLEAQACGTPVITYRAGGSPESVPDENVVEAGDLDSVVKLIEKGNLRVRQM